MVIFAIVIDALASDRFDRTELDIVILLDKIDIVKFATGLPFTLNKLTTGMVMVKLYYTGIIITIVALLGSTCEA